MPEKPKRTQKGTNDSRRHWLYHSADDPWHRAPILSERAGQVKPAPRGCEQAGAGPRAHLVQPLSCQSWGSRSGQEVPLGRSILNAPAERSEGAGDPGSTRERFPKSRMGQRAAACPRNCGHSHSRLNGGFSPQPLFDMPAAPSNPSELTCPF
jgi:hypothetical protein